jgi:hypothetical protein
MRCCVTASRSSMCKGRGTLRMSWLHKQTKRDQVRVYQRGDSLPIPASASIAAHDRIASYAVMLASAAHPPSRHKTQAPHLHSIHVSCICGLNARVMEAAGARALPSAVPRMWMAACLCLCLHVGAPLDQRLHRLQLALLRRGVERCAAKLLHRRRQSRVSQCECQRAPAPVPTPCRPRRLPARHSPSVILCITL